MTTVNKSLSYVDNTIVYNNEYELYYIDDYNPLKLPAYTIRVELLPNEVEPNINYNFRNDKLTMTQVSASPNIWDITYMDSVWDFMFDNGYGGDNVKGVIGGNLTGVTSIIQWFYSTDILEYVNIIDTPNVTNMTASFEHCTKLVNIPRCFNLASVEDMTNAFKQCCSLVHLPEFVNSSNLRILKGTFADCTSLIDIPLFDTSNVTDMSNMFIWCHNVESGALALYQQASTQANPPIYHTGTFEECGINTQTGAAELAQIPADWK